MTKLYSAHMPASTGRAAVCESPAIAASVLESTQCSILYSVRSELLQSVLSLWYWIEVLDEHCE